MESAAVSERGTPLGFAEDGAQTPPRSLTEDGAVSEFRYRITGFPPFVHWCLEEKSVGLVACGMALTKRRAFEQGNDWLVTNRAPDVPHHPQPPADIDSETLGGKKISRFQDSAVRAAR